MYSLSHVLRFYLCTRVRACVCYIWYVCVYVGMCDYLFCMPLFKKKNNNLKEVKNLRINEFKELKIPELF